MRQSNSGPLSIIRPKMLQVGWREMEEKYLFGVQIFVEIIKTIEQIKGSLYKS